MKNEKQIKIDGYKCIKLDEWKTEWEADQSEGRDSDRIKTGSGGTYLIFLSQGQKEETV